MKEKKLNVSDYGLYLLSPMKLKSFLKNEKIRSSKVLSYFQKNHNQYIKSIENGAWLPILPIDSIDYVIKVQDSFDEEWLPLIEQNEFNLEVLEDNSVWIGSISNLHSWNSSDFTNEIDFHSYETLDDETLYGAFRFDLKQGKYLVKIKGYKRRKEVEYPETNFGFSFEFKEVSEFSGYKDPREDDKYFFNVAQIEN